MDSLVHAIYRSSAVEPMSNAELLELLGRARVVNTEMGLTGVLLHADGSFFQVLEGEPDAVDELYPRIARDRRHQNVVMIVREAIAQRAFGEWSMGFESVTRAEVAGIVGVNDFFQAGSCFENLTPGRARKLLEAFAQGSWRARRAS
jgi:hypothetical protein